MKRFVSGAALLAAAALLVTSCGKEQPKSAPGSTVAAAGKTGETIVFVNSDSLLTKYEYFTDIKNAMEEKSKKAQGDLTAKGSAFQREVNEYNQAAQSMSADQRASTEERLGRKQRELQSLNENARSALANESAAENEKLYEKVAAYLKVYAKDKGYKYVLTFSKTNPSILFADESLDVTKDVVNGLNEQYKKDKK